MKIRLITQIFLFLFPWKVRKYFLRKVLKFNLGSNTKIGYSVVLADNVELLNLARIGHFTFIGNISNLIMRENSFIGPLNWITGLTKRNPKYFSYNPERKCELILEQESSITSRHIIDCNGGVYVGEYSIIAGYRTQILSHSVDVHISRQTCGPIVIGKYCFVSTGCILLKGAVLPDFSILGAGSVLNKSYSASYTLYAGVPAKPKIELDPEKTKFFSREKSFIE